MRSILNVITATIAHPSNAIAFETTYYLTRTRKLTVSGAQRILRKVNPYVIVTRVQTLIHA